MAPRERAWVPKAGKEWFYIDDETAKVLLDLVADRGITTRQDFVAKVIDALKAPVTVGAPASDTIGESSGSPFRPVCIWPNIRKFTPRTEDEYGNVTEWDKEEYECPIRLEDRGITVAELSKSHCSKCPIRKEHELKQKRKSARKYSRYVGRGTPDDPFRVRAVSGGYLASHGGGFSGSQSLGWGNGR